MELLLIKVIHSTNKYSGLFCSRDLDLDLMIFIHEHSLIGARRTESSNSSILYFWHHFMFHFTYLLTYLLAANLL